MRKKERWELLVERIKVIASTSVEPTPEVAEEVLKALRSPWQGLQALAAELPGRWGRLAMKRGGSREPWFSLMKGWMFEVRRRPGDWEESSAAARVAVKGMLDERDIPWVLQLLHEHGREFEFFADILPPEVTLAHWVEMAEHGHDKARLRALRWLREHPFEGLAELLAARAERDPMRPVRELAATLHAEVVAEAAACKRGRGSARGAPRDQ
jgi:hypothetical protein